MSVLVWKNVLKPGAGGLHGIYDPPVYGERCRIHRAVRFPEANEELVLLPDPRLYRSLSRTGLLLIAAAWPAESVLRDLLISDPHSVGIYCAIEQGPNDFACAEQMVNLDADEFAVNYKRLRSAKQYLNQLPSVPPSQLSILMGIMGPQYVYQHSVLAGLHALDQAEADLHDGVVEAAIVCGSFTLEDALINLRVVESASPGKPLSEGAAALVLRRGSERRNWNSLMGNASDVNYGITEKLIGAAENYETNGR